MPPALLDTNVLVYLYDQNSPVKQERARQVLDLLNKLGTGYFSVQSLAEFANVARGKLDPPLSAEQIYRQVAMLIASWKVINLTPQIVLDAARGVRDHGLAYYDAQIWAAARLNQIPVIFSEDFQDGQVLEGVRFVNPFSDRFHLDDWA